jgi:glycosyltransferase involved in cell wall biosynthesis
MIRVPSRLRFFSLLPRRNKIQLVIFALSGIAIIFLLVFGNINVRFLILITMMVVSIRFRSARFKSTSLHFLALVKARLYGYHGKSNDLRYLIYRSSDAIEYLLNDISRNAIEVEEFYEQNGISKTRVCFEELSNSPTWRKRDAYKVAGLARYLILSQISSENLIAGLNLYGCLLKHSKNKVFRNRLVEPHFQHQRVFLDGLISVGDFEEWHSAHTALAQKLKNFQSVKSDAENPFIDLGIDTSEDTWLNQFNKYFKHFNLQEVKLDGSDDSPFDRLSTVTLPKITGPLVTIIVSAYNPGRELITAIKSLLNQTWENIEVIIVDDFSTETAYLDTAKLMDPRIKLLRQSENLGTYAARNLGIRNSTGIFVTTHDSDDWAHPQRIELQAKNLLAREKNLANLSWCVRVSSDLKVSTLGFSETRLNASSLMFRRELVERIGYFDEVRKGADAEFRMRIGAQFPGSVTIIGFQPLSIIRIGHQSLSRSDFSPLWIHPNRHLYKQSYETWHKTKNLTEFTISPDSRSYRLPFPSPDAYLNHSDSSGPIVFDMLVAANFSSGITPENIGLKYINQFTEKGVKIGALNLKSLDLSDPFDPEFQKLVSTRKIQCIPQDTVATVKKLLVIDPEFLLLKSFLPQLLEVEEIQIHIGDLQGLLRRFQEISGIRIALDDQHELKNLICRIEKNATSLFNICPTFFFASETDLSIINSLGITGVDIRLEPANT